jgi:hypothetical protein
MPLQDERFETWTTIHASAHNHARSLLRPAAAEPRAKGAVRYRCPVTGSFVLVTEEATLARLKGPPARLRCADCGEEHLMTIEADDPAHIVARPDRP